MNSHHAVSGETIDENGAEAWDSKIEIHTRYNSSEIQVEIVGMTTSF
jgi:hypothetical protein